MTGGPTTQKVHRDPYPTCQRLLERHQRQPRQVSRNGSTPVDNPTVQDYDGPHVIEPSRNVKPLRAPVPSFLSSRFHALLDSRRTLHSAFLCSPPSAAEAHSSSTNTSRSKSHSTKHLVIYHLTIRNQERDFVPACCSRL